jgi:hypothetical protein
MSYTKTAYSEMQRGESLRNCTDPKKCPGQYWDGGARLIQYDIQNFKDARREDTLNMRNPRFVPKVNLTKQAMDYAKEMGFKITLPSHSPDGRYLIHTTNGPNMIPGLADTFMSVFGDDPAATEYYNALSKLNRNDFMYSEENISKYGSKDAAEMYYLDDTHRKIVEATEAQLAEAKRQEALASNKKETIDGIITNKGVDPNDPKDQKLVKDRYQTLVDQMISSSNAETHETDLNAVASDDFQTLDLESKRSRIDGVAARSLLQGDLYQAANDYAMQTMDVKTEVDQYSLKQFDHMLNMARMSAQHAYDKALDDHKTENQKRRYKFEKTIDMVAGLYPNGKKNGATPDGANPANPGWTPIAALAGGTAMEADLKTSDAKTLISATGQAESTAVDVMMKGYEQLKSIIDTPDGKPTSGGVIMTPGIRAYYQGKLKEIYGSSTVEMTKAKSGPEGESVLGLMWNTFTSLFTGDLGSETETPVTSGGYLDENGNLLYSVDGRLGKSFSSNPNFTKPGSEYSWEKVAERVANFFNSDPIGMYSTTAEIDPATGQYASGILGAIDQYGLSSQNYNNFLKTQMTNNKVVHDQLMGGAAGLEVYDELSTYPTAVSDPNASFWDKVYGIDAPAAIKEHTKASLEKMVTSGGGIMTLPEFTNIYANSPEARQIAERVVQETYKTQPGQQGGFNKRSYDDAVNTVIEYLGDDAEDVYEEYMSQFTKIYNQDTDAVVKNADLKGFTPLSHFYQFNDSGAGVQANPLVATVDPAYPGDIQAHDFLDLYNKIIQNNMGKSSNGIKVFEGLGGDLSERRFFSDDPDAVDSNEGAFTTLQALRTQLLQGRDIDDKSRGTFDMYMHPITLNDQNQIAFSFSVSPEYADDNTGTGKAMKFMNKSGRQFTIVIDKNAVPEVENLEMVKRLNQGPYTIAMRANKKINLTSFPLGGNLTIKPTGDDSYAASGLVNYMDPETFQLVPTEYTSFMGAGQSLENFAQQQNQMLAGLHMQVVAAQEQIKALSSNLIRDPKEFDNQ